MMMYYQDAYDNNNLPNIATVKAILIDYIQVRHK